MPKIYEYIKKNVTWVFWFWSVCTTENRPHVHVGRKTSSDFCKFWLEPEVSLSENKGLKEKELSEIEKITKEHQKELIKMWHQFKANPNIKFKTKKINKMKGV